MDVKSTGMSLEFTDQCQGSAQLEAVTRWDTQDRRNGSSGTLVVEFLESQNVHGHTETAYFAKHLLEGLYDGALEEGREYFNGTACGSSWELSGR